MSEQQTNSTELQGLAEVSATTGSADEKCAAHIARSRNWLERNKIAITSAVILGLVIWFVAHVFLVVIPSAVEETNRTFLERQTAHDKQSAYYDVILNRVAVNGERGTPEWREYYRQALERVLSTHDFSDFCTYNGFLKDSTKAGVLPCIAAGDVRAVRSTDGGISYFKENSIIHKVAALDVMEQDIHADDYLDIDVFTKALDARATKLASAEFDAKLDDIRRSIETATKRLLPRIESRPSTVVEQPKTFGDSGLPPELNLH
jgi:hypothetical protein